MTTPIRKDIVKWMRSHIKDHRDALTGEVDCTSLVESWDSSESTGGSTLDPMHPAWDIAVEVSS